MTDEPLAKRPNGDGSTAEARYYRLEARVGMLEAAVRERIIDENLFERRAEQLHADHESRMRVLEKIASELRGSLKTLNWILGFVGIGGIASLIWAITKVSGT